MGSGISRTASSSSSPRAGPHRRNMRRSISSVLICGASSSSSAQMEDYPDDLLVNSAEHCHKKKKFPRRISDVSVRNADDLNNENVVSSRRLFGAYENCTFEVGANHDEPGDRGKQLTESRTLVPSNQYIDSSKYNETASSSHGGQPSCFLVSGNKITGIDGTNGVHCNLRVDTSQNGQTVNNSSGVYNNALSEPLLDEVSVENNVRNEVDCSTSDFGSSCVSHSLLDLHDSAQEVTHPDLGFLISERGDNRQDESLLHFDMLSISNTSPTNSGSRQARRNSRRLLRDTFLRRPSRRSRRQSDSGMTVFSPVGSDRVRSPDRRFLDFNSAFIEDDEFRGDLSSQGSLSPGHNDQQLNFTSESRERVHGSIDSIYYPPPACPRGVHTGGSCLCQSILSAEESGPRIGVSRVVMLADALFEVLDRIHQQPVSLSLSVVSPPAPESVVDSFPVKTHVEIEKSKSTDDVSQCYICLSEYEEGEQIRILPCHHEYHLSCVDKWLKEIHGVCPLCRGDVHLGSTEK